MNEEAVSIWIRRSESDLKIGRDELGTEEPAADAMTRILLQSMVEAIPDNHLTANWADFDLTAFSQDKALWDYQQRALQNALKALWKYYQDFGDCRSHESLKINRQHKGRRWQWYQDNGLGGPRS